MGPFDNCRVLTLHKYCVQPRVHPPLQDCMLDANGVCTSALPSAFTLKQQSVVVVANVAEQRILTMILDFSKSGGYKPTYTVSDVRKIFLGDAEDGNGGVAHKYSQCSYGKFGINVAAFKAIIMTTNISTAGMNTCNWYTISTTADQAARDAIGDDAFRSFSHHVYVLPPGMQSICRWAGLALLPGHQVWLQSSPYGIERWATVMQESIHNYGML